jgi:outer membrane receptor protein involved in Fe transport
VWPGFTLNGGMVAMSGALARGNENNGHRPDGTFYLGQGRSAGYAIFNLGTNYRVTPRWQLLAQVNNLFDKRYSTAAQLGPTGFDASGNFLARPFGGSAAGTFPLAHSTFYAPGAPRLIWVGLRYGFDQAASE